MSYLDIDKVFNWVLKNDEYVIPTESDIMSFWLAIMGNRPYRSSGNKISHVYHPALRYIFRFLSMTILCYGEPSGVSKPELAAMQSFLEYDQGTLYWVDIFVGRCINVQECDKGKISIGGMVTLRVMYLGIDIPDNVPKSVANTTIFYGMPTLLRVQFIQYRQPYTCSLIILNGCVVSLSPIPETVFYVRNDDTAKMLCDRTLAYSHQHPEGQAPMATGVHIGLDGGKGEDEEEEDYVPSVE